MESKSASTQYDPPRTACEICGSTRISLHLVDFSGNRIFKCAGCKIQFLNPQYSQQHLADYYSDGYAKDEPEWDEPLACSHHYYLSLIEKLCPSKGRLLDIGCGKGHLLLAAKERGWAPVGFEMSETSAALAARRTEVQTLYGRFEEIDWGSKVFDVVTMHHVLEHLKSPIPYLTVIGNILKDRGILFLVLPNVQARSAVLKFALEKLGLRRKRVGAYYGTKDHLWYYSPRSLRFLLGKFGFNILHMQSGHRVLPGQSDLSRFFMRNFSDRLLWKSTFLAISRKQDDVAPEG